MSDPYIGQIQPFAFQFQPKGWALCKGQLLNISQYTALYALVGTTYGGNGQTTFGLPDLQGRAPVGQGTGAGLQAYVMGQKTGTQTATMTIAQMPSHTHGFTGSGGSGGAVMASSQPGTQSAPSATVNTLAGLAEDSGGNTLLLYNNQAPNTALNTGGGGGGGGTISITGAGIPFPITQPLLAINYSIALVGIFPSRD